ncbi:inhibitor of Bruton tyrosine kinase-like [Mytilus galloprovincialis]|uniref:inhibitor of Bruton tyrosine kinase-like n=1 Tax=Mytilus galloprovincialis TaxID=29158 RepID=UPI003F7B844D
MECGLKCKSKRHALEVNAAVTKGLLEEIQAYCKLCYASTQMTDIYGRTTLHVAASCGKCDVVEWLMTDRNADATLKDVESGWTALHRAAFYGQMAAFRLLVQFNCDLYSRDHEGLSPLDLFLKNVPVNVSFSDQDANSVYSWGDNTNFTLGHSTEQRRIYPERVEMFKNDINVKDIVMCKYHSVFLSHTGQVYTCGHGQGGRLGHGDEHTCLVPRQVESLNNEVCIQIAAARDHTLILVESGIVYSCGLNESHQLGQTVKKSLLPKPINGKVLKGKQIKGICAGRFHSVVYTNHAVFTCGLNAGQLGHPKSQDRFCPLRQVSALNQKDIFFEKVECSDAAVVCLTSQGDIYVLHEYQCRKIASKWQDIVKMSVSGGNLDHNTDMDVLREKGGTELTILLQHSLPGKIFIWRTSSPVLKRCRWAIRRQIIVQDVCLSLNSVSIVTDNGEAFIGTINPKKSSPKDIVRQNSINATGDDDFGKMRLIDLLLKDEIEDVLLRRLPNIHRATQIFCDRKGRNFTVLQSKPNLCVTDVPSISPSSMIEDCEQIMEEADEFDMIHDVIIKIGGHSWIAHKYILLSRCDYFHRLLAESKKMEDDDTSVITVQGTHPDIFDQLVKFIYTDTCDLLTPGAKFELSKISVENGAEDDFLGKVMDTAVITSPHTTSAFEVLKKKKGHAGKKDEKQVKSTNPVKMLQDLAKKYGIKGLPKRLEAVKCIGGKIDLLPNRFLPKPSVMFDRQREKGLYDVCIQSEDGVEFMCHKCILVARLEYFQSMLSCGWVETSNTKSLNLPVTGEVLEILLDYLYTDKSVVITDTDNVELLCNILVVADQMLVVRLKEMCETSLSQLVTFKNVGELLEFSSLYNATQLKSTCQQYIHINLAALMEGRYLDILSDEVIGDLMSYYREQVPVMCRRIITPWDEGPDKAYLEEIAQGPKMEDNFETPTRKSKSKKRRSRNKSMSEEVDKSGSLRQRQISISSDISVKSDDEITELDTVSSPTEPVFKDITMEDRTNRDKSSPVSITIPPGGSKWGPTPLSPSPGPVWPKSPQSFTETKVQGSDLRQIMEEEDKDHTKSTSPSPKRFSWKDVKKQQAKSAPAQKGQSTEDTSQNNNIESEPVKAACPWGEVGKVAKSFRDLMIEDKKIQNTQQKSGQSVQNLNQNAQQKSGQGAQCVKQSTQQKSGQNAQNSHQCTQQKSGQGAQNLNDRGPRNKKAAENTKSTHVPTDLLDSSSKSTKSIPVTKGQVATTMKSASNLFSWGLPTSAVHQRKESVSETPIENPQSPTEAVNPWQQRQEAASAKSFSFTEIVKDEIQKHETLARATNKPLGLIQIEEQAIQELLQYYRASESFDECISVERVPQAMAAPLWTAKQQKQSHV